MRYRITVLIWNTGSRGRERRKAVANCVICGELREWWWVIVCCRKTTVQSLKVRSARGGQLNYS